VLLALGGLGVLLGGVASVWVVVRRGKSASQSQWPGGDELEAARFEDQASHDELEAALQEFLAEERARDATPAGA